jgi:hypothetical protein
VAVLSHDKFHRITRETDGSVRVSVEMARGEHPATTRAAALRYVRASLGAEWTIGAYLGHEHYRRFDGYPATARRWSAIRTA